MLHPHLAAQCTSIWTCKKW